MALFLYRALQWILSPLLVGYVLMRFMRGREDPHHFGERMGKADMQRPAGPLLWVHGASVGEVLSTHVMLKKLRMLSPEVHVLLTSGTRTGMVTLERLKPQLEALAPAGGKVLVQFSPIDFSGAVKRFVKHWQPSVSVFTESDFWPNLLAVAPNPVLLNGRISDRSWKKYKKYGWFFRPFVQRFTHVLAQRDIDAERLRAMGAKNVEIGGNLKFDADPLSVDEAVLAKLKEAVGGRPVLLFASTHPGEEVIAADMHLKLKTSIEGLLTVIVPRHPHRGTHASNDVARLIKYTARRGLGELPQNGPRPTDVYIADTLGELGLFYRLATVVVMGGSLVKHGGQNPLEPLKVGTPVLTGPHMHNFRDMVPLLTNKKLLHVAKSVEALTKDIQVLMTNAENLATLRKYIALAIPTFSGASTTAAHLLDERLKMVDK